MNPRPFAWIVGTILLLFGILGFVPPLAPEVTSPLRIAADVGGRQLFGVFPVSPLLSALHAAIGLWGLLGGSSLTWAMVYARVAGFVFIVLLVMGFIPGTDDLFGNAPLYGNNLLLHGVLAVLFFLFGWLYRRHPLEDRPAQPPHQPTNF